MDLEKEYTCIEKNSCVFAKQIDNDEDYQQTLPEYCDDLLKVVNCSAHSFIMSVDTNYSEVKIFGKTIISITYYSESNELCYADFEEEFVKLVTVDNLTDSAFSCATLCDKYANFRVINQRRIDVHCSCCINLKVYDTVKCNCVSKCNKSKLKLQQLDTYNVCASTVTKAEFDEEFSITPDTTPIKRIICCSSFANVSETRIIKDKALVKIDVNITALYTQDNDNCDIAKSNYIFSTSKIIDIGGIDDGDIILPNVKVGNVYLKSKNSNNQQLTVIEAIGDICISAIFLKKSCDNIITDGYVLNKKSKCEYVDYKCAKDGNFVNSSVTKNLMFECSAEFKEIKNVGISINDVSYKNGKITAKAVADIVYISQDNLLMTYNNSTEFEIEVSEYNNAWVGLNVKSYDFTMKSNTKIDVRLNLDYQVYLYNETNIKLLNEIDADEQDIDYPALSIYFAKKDETVWSIAKKFSSDIDMIIKENDLASDAIDCNKVLIIPGV